MRVKLGAPMRMSEIAYAIRGKRNLNNDPFIEFLSTDTRELKKGDLFIAIKGESYDGEDFIGEAKSKGAYTLSKNISKADIFHTDSKAALLSLAEYYNKTLPIILYRVGITGSVGKTTTKEFLSVLLSGNCKYHISKGNHNNDIGMPMSILSTPTDTEILVMEMGMNHPGEIRRLSTCLRPNIAVITNIGTAHIGNLGSRENIAEAKLEITEKLNDGATIVPYEEPLLKNAKNKVTFSVENEEADYYLKAENGQISLYKNQSFLFSSSFALEEKSNRLCLAAALSSALEAGISPNKLSSRIPYISEENTRQRVFYIKNRRFLTDFYNASYESVIALLDEAKNHDHPLQKSLVLGDILELGELSERIHFMLGKSISHKVFRSLFLFGSESIYIARGAIENGFPMDRIFINRDVNNPTLSAEQIYKETEDGEMIFMKASRAIRLERVLDCLKEY